MATLHKWLHTVVNYELKYFESKLAKI